VATKKAMMKCVDNARKEIDKRIKSCIRELQDLYEDRGAMVAARVLIETKRLSEEEFEEIEARAADIDEGRFERTF
jgi:hypothetical protein